MALLSVLVPDVRMEVPEVPSFVAQRQLLRAMREFCEFTRAWRVNVSVGVTKNVATVNLTSLLPGGTELVDIISMKNADGGAPPEPRTYRWLVKNISDWRSESEPDANYYVLDGNNTVRFMPTPSATTAGKYTARVSVKPLLTATTINDVLVNKYSELFIHGALAYLYAVPRKPWTDASLAQYHDLRFRDGLPSARAEAADEFQTGIPRKVKYGGL